jgi:hypothetical protein
MADGSTAYNRLSEAARLALQLHESLHIEMVQALF